MMLNFKIWLEERSSERKIRNMFLSRLGFDKSATNDTSVHSMKVSSYSDRIEKALKSMGLTDDKLDRLLAWMKTYPERSLQDLLNQIDPRDISLPQKDRQLPGKPALLPPPGDLGPAPSMQGMDGNPGIPPRQSSMQIPY